MAERPVMCGSERTGGQSKESRRTVETWTALHSAAPSKPRTLVVPPLSLSLSLLWAVTSRSASCWRAWWRPRRARASMRAKCGPHTSIDQCARSADRSTATSFPLRSIRWSLCRHLRLGRTTSSPATAQLSSARMRSACTVLVRWRTSPWPCGSSRCRFTLSTSSRSSTHASSAAPRTALCLSQT